jgi:hypothetical protein
MADRITLHAPEQVIIDTAKKKLSTAREKTKLQKYGMGEEFCAKLESDIATAAGFKTDEEISSDIETMTTLKNNKVAEAGEWGVEVKIRMELAFEERPEVVKEFPSDFTKAKKDEKLMLERVPNINNLIDKYAVQLQAKGLPADHKEAGIAILNQIDTLNKTQEKMKEDRPQYTVRRIEAYTLLYDTINKINKVGRKAYKKSAADLKAFSSPWPVTEKKSNKKNGKNGGVDKKNEGNKTDDEKK